MSSLIHCFPPFQTGEKLLWEQRTQKHNNFDDMNDPWEKLRLQKEKRNRRSWKLSIQAMLKWITKKSSFSRCLKIFFFHFLSFIEWHNFILFCVYFRVYHHLRCTRYYVIVYYCCWLIVKKLTWDWNVCGAINNLKQLDDFFLCDILEEFLCGYLRIYEDERKN